MIGDERCWEPAGYGKVQAIGKFAIARPFLVRTEIGDRTLDLDSNDLAASPDSQNIGAASVSEREFDERGIAELVQGAANSARQSTGINRFYSEYVGGRNGHDTRTLLAMREIVVNHRPVAMGGVR